MKKLIGSWIVFAALGCTPAKPDEQLEHVDPPKQVRDTPADPRETLPAVSGGTMTLTQDGAVAVISDPDTDQIFVVDLAAKSVLGTVYLETAEEPGRIAIDGRRAYAVLRRAGQVVAFDVSATPAPRRFDACPEARGVAVDPSRGLLFIACSSGELLTLNANTGEKLRSLRLDPDLRDVVVSGEELYVSRFRTAEVLHLAADGRVIERLHPATAYRKDIQGNVLGTFEAAVAWRMTPWPGGGFLLSHQRAMVDAVDVSVAPDSSTGSSAYGGSAGAPCSSLVHSAITIKDAQGMRTRPITGNLPVDAAVSGDGQFIAMVMYGSGQYAHVESKVITDADSNRCFGLPIGEETSLKPVAVAFLPSGQTVKLEREPLRLSGPFGEINLGAGRHDDGMTIFHKSAPGFVSCASCHPEATDDGRVWHFLPMGKRRSQTLAGGLAPTAPFHWDGDLRDISHLVDEVYIRRMGAPKPTSSEVSALNRWLDGLPVVRVPSPSGVEAEERGKALFNDPVVACGSCHSGALFTNNTSWDVGTGAPFQVPVLRSMALRAPYMHDGCAPTLKDRFGACGGGDRHGKTSHLTDAQINDLVAYLESL